MVVRSTRGRRAVTGVLAALTVGGSALGVLGSAGPAGAVTVPAGWKTLYYGSIKISVPSAWPVESWRSHCGSATPVVFRGPEGTEGACSSREYAPVVTLGAKAPPLPRVGSTETRDGVWAIYVTSKRQEVPGKGNFITLWAQADGVWVSIFADDPRAAGGLAHQIEATFVPVGQPTGGGGGFF